MMLDKESIQVTLLYTEDNLTYENILKYIAITFYSKKYGSGIKFTHK